MVCVLESLLLIMFNNQLINWMDLTTNAGQYIAKHWKIVELVGKAQKWIRQCEIYLGEIILWSH